METTEFWDNVFAQGQEGRYGQLKMPDLDNPVLRRALVYFGDMKNKTLIDIGCGSGAPSLFFAYHGADVISIDSSGVAIENLSQYCQENGIGNIKPVKMQAQEISELEKADFVFGSMILHHIEPFEEFARSLREIVKPGGKGFFRENNARSENTVIDRIYT